MSTLSQVVQQLKNIQTWIDEVVNGHRRIDQFGELDEIKDTTDFHVSEADIDYRFPFSKLSDEIKEKTLNDLVIDWEDIENRPEILTGEIDVSAVWSGTGFNFEVTADSYPIGNTLYSAFSGQVTLADSEANLDRIDLIVVAKPVAPETQGIISVIEGMPASTNLVVPPNYDPSIYYVILQVSVLAGATQPDGVENTVVYSEGTEWALSFSPDGDVAQTSNDPYSGSNSIEGTDSGFDGYVRFTSPTVLPVSRLDLFRFFFKDKTPRNSQFFIRIRNGASLISNFSFEDGQFGYVGLNPDYQAITINKNEFNFNGSEFDSIEIGFNAIRGDGFFIDNVVIAKGSGSEDGGSGTDPITPNSFRRTVKPFASGGNFLLVKHPTNNDPLKIGTIENNDFITNGYRDNTSLWGRAICLDSSDLNNDNSWRVLEDYSELNII